MMRTQLPWTSYAPQILEAVTSPVVVTDRSGRIVYVNTGFTRVTGYTAEEAIGDNPRLLASGAHDEAFYAEMWATILAGRTWHGEVVNRRKSGERYTDRQTITPLYDEDGRISHFLAVKTDVVEQLQLLAATSPVGVFHADTAGRWTYASRHAATLAGRPFEELVGDGWRAAVHERDRGEAERSWDALVAGRQDEASMLLRMGAEGESTWVQLRAVRRRVVGGEAAFDDIVGSLEAVDELVAARERLAEREQELRAIFAAAPDGLLTLGEDGRVTSANEVACELFGYGRDELIGCESATLVAEVAEGEDGRDRLAPTRPAVDEAPTAADGEATREATALHRDGRRIPVELSVATAAVSRGELTVVSVRDITARKVHEERLAFQALHDPLTGLANRALLDDRLEQMLRASERTGEVFAVHLLDLDGFKAVNDTRGHAVGDALLVEVAERLTRTVRAADTIARLGGDEFVVLTGAISSPDDADLLANRLVGVLERAFADAAAPVTASLGTVAVSATDCTAAEVLRRADAAMYEAKASGRNRAVVDRALLSVPAALR
ncbi:MAG: PAS domain S-box protein [Actinomycetota bacterium]